VSEDIKKTLPLELNSDYSLPGRFEESNFEITEPVEPSSKNRLILISIVSFVIIASGFFGYYFLNQDLIDKEITKNIIKNPEKKQAFQYGIGAYGSEHAHAALMIVVDEDQVNFGLPQFQLANKYIHFEDNNPYLIHKHATGVPLKMLFESLKVEITQECIIFKNTESTENEAHYCITDEQTRTTYLNGKIYTSDILEYEIRHGDRILISFSDSESISKNMRYLDSLEIYDIPKKSPQNYESDITV
jgi:hypothetical protein